MYTHTSPTEGNFCDRWKLKNCHSCRLVSTWAISTKGF